MLFYNASTSYRHILISYFFLQIDCRDLREISFLLLFINYSIDRQRKLEELKAQALATQKLREQKEEGKYEGLISCIIRF